MKTAIQLYTVRDDYKDQDGFKNILKEVKEIGYDGVEFAGYCGFDAKTLKAYLDEIRLEPVSTHVSLESLQNHTDEIFQYAKELGCKYVALAFSDSSTEELLNETSHLLRTADQLALQYGIKLCYHNHSHELRKVDATKTVLDIFKEDCLLEPDTYWLMNAKVNPVDFLHEYASRIALVHLKDGDAQGTPCTLGQGINDIHGIIKASEEIGIEWIVVENDCPKPTGLASIRESFQYMTHSK